MVSVGVDVKGLGLMLVAGQPKNTAEYIPATVEGIAERAGEVTRSNEVRDTVRAELKHRLDVWLHEAQNRTGGTLLSYRRSRDDVSVHLLEAPGAESWKLFTCPTSMRDVEPAVNLVLDHGDLDDLAPLATAADGGAIQEEGGNVQ